MQPFVTLCIPLLFAGCGIKDDDASATHSETERLEREERDAALARKREADERMRRLEEELEKEKEESAERRREEEAAKQTELDAEKKAAEDARRAARVEILAARQHLIGTEFPELATKDGATYTEALVQEVGDTGITIYHVDGVAEVDYEQLSPELQKRFRYDKEEADRIRAGGTPAPVTSAMKREIKERLHQLRQRQLAGDTEEAKAASAEVESLRARVQRGETALAAVEKRIAAVKEELDAQHRANDAREARDDAARKAERARRTDVERHEAEVARITAQLDELRARKARVQEQLTAVERELSEHAGSRYFR